MPNPMIKSGKHGPASIVATGTKIAEHEVRKESNQCAFCLHCNAWRGELGLEPTIELYISHLLQIFDEVKRVLKKTGTCWVNIGDSYAGGKGQSGQPLSSEQQENRVKAGLSITHGQNQINMRIRPQDSIKGLQESNVQSKSLCGIPERFVLGMQEHGWIKRNTIIWYKKNPMPESVKDRFTEDFEYLYFFVKNKKYWFEQQFEPQQFFDNRASGMERQGEQYRDKTQGKYSENKNYGGGGSSFLGHSGYYKANGELNVNPLGRNKRCVWEINTEPYPEAHFATFPEKLCETPILAGCPSQICTKCGKAREKVYGNSEWESHQSEGMAALDTPDSPMYRGGHHNDGLPYRANSPIDKGYTDCGCDVPFEPGVVLDPFCGSGTVLAVAKKLGRKAIGIDLNPKYCDLAVKRLQKIPLSLKF